MCIHWDKPQHLLMRKPFDMPLNHCQCMQLPSLHCKANKSQHTSFLVSRNLWHRNWRLRHTLPYMNWPFPQQCNLDDWPKLLRDGKHIHQDKPLGALLQPFDMPLSQ
jgi:hypothetical protein